MKLIDGYYVSSYLFVDKLSSELQAIVRHDQNLALWKKENDNIELIHYWELERMSGLKKHGVSFRNSADVVDFITHLLKEYKLKMKDINGIIGTPGLDTIEEYSSVGDYAHISYHSICHLMSSVLLDTNIFYNAQIMGFAVDGGSDDVVDLNANNKNLFCGCYINKGKVDIIPVASPAPLWSFARIRYDLRQGSLMALASASASKVLFDVSPFYDIYNNSDIEKAYIWFNNLAIKIEKLERKDIGVLFNGYDERFSEKDNKISMLMKVIQGVSIDIMRANVDLLRNKFGVDPSKTYLALSGGYALNCLTNTVLLDEYKFIDFMAPPCVNDAGQSLGSGLYFFYKNLNKFSFCFKEAYYGNRICNVENVLKEYSIYIKNYKKVSFDVVAKDLIDNVVVWVDGRSEIGPRALGNRSLLGDPRSKKVKAIMNEIKKRQWWRPVAPVVLEERTSDWFETVRTSRYMLQIAKVSEQKQNTIPATVHLDGTARFQTVSMDSNSNLYRLLFEFEKLTGVPLVCNTSLNDCGEPIIETVEEAINFALRKGITYIYVCGIRIELCNHSQYKRNNPLRRPYYKLFCPDIKSEKSENDELIKKYYRYYGIRRLFYDGEREEKILRILKMIDATKSKLVDSEGD